MERNRTAEHREAGARHESAAKTHERASRFWDDQGDAQRAALQRAMAEYEREGAELERRWARLTDPSSPHGAIQANDAVRRQIRQGAKQAFANLMALAETLERSAHLAEEHARRRELEVGSSDHLAEEHAAAERAHDAARRARSQAVQWRSLAADDT